MPLYAHERLFQHRCAVGLEPAYEANLVGLGVKFAQALDLHAQCIDDPVITKVAEQTDILAGRKSIRDEF